MSNRGPYDDETEIASPGGKRKKFIDSETQLKTEIYQTDPVVKPPPPSASAQRKESPFEAIGTPAPRAQTENPPEIKERVQRVFDVADALLAGLSVDGTNTDVTAPGSPKALGPAAERAHPAAAAHSLGTAPTDLREIAAEARGDSTEDLEDRPDSIGGETTQVAAVAAAHGDETTQVEAVSPAAELSSPVSGPTIPGHPGAPPAHLSDQPFAPGPMSQPALAIGDALGVSPDHSGDGFGTLTTEPPPPHLAAAGMQPARFQDAQAPIARGGLRGMWDSLMRFFGRQPPPPAPPDDGADDDDFSSYGRGTYTVANRLVKRHGKRRHRGSEPPPQH